MPPMTAVSVSCERLLTSNSRLSDRPTIALRKHVSIHQRQIFITVTIIVFCDDVYLTIAKALHEATVATKWIRQFRTSGGSAVFEAWVFQPILGHGLGRVEMGKSDRWNVCLASLQHSQDNVLGDDRMTVAAGGDTSVGRRQGMSLYMTLIAGGSKIRDGLPGVAAVLVTLGLAPYPMSPSNFQALSKQTNARRLGEGGTVSPSDTGWLPQGHSRERSRGSIACGETGETGETRVDSN